MRITKTYPGVSIGTMQKICRTSSYRRFEKDGLPEDWVVFVKQARTDERKTFKATTQDHMRTTLQLIARTQFPFSVFAQHRRLGRVLDGPCVEAIFPVGFLINMALISASAFVTLTIGLNTVSERATCTVVFTVA